jgi:sec-independent protein translocase protein TatC
MFLKMLQRFFKFRDEQPGEATKPFLEHLEDLRWMIVKMAITLGLCMVGSFGFRHRLVQIAQEPLRGVDPRLVASLRTLGVADSITISLKLAFYAGIVLSFPLLMFFLAQFVLPALTRKEKRYVLPGIAIGSALFLLGVLFSYHWVLPMTLRWFFHDTLQMGWTPEWTVLQYYSFVTQLTLAFGFAFELPVAILMLVHLGMLSFAFLHRTRSYAIVIILMVAIVIAPTPDVLTFLALGTPMVLMYEACIWAAWLLEKRRLKSRAAAEIER